MSYSGSIQIYTNTEIGSDVFFELLFKLQDIGWTANISGHNIIMINDSYDWNKIKIGNFDNVIELMKNSINNDLVTCIDLEYKTDSLTIGLYYLSKKEIMISILDYNHILESCKIVDFSLYLNKIAIIFTCIDFYRINCNYD